MKRQYWLFGKCLGKLAISGSVTQEKGAKANPNSKKAKVPTEHEDNAERSEALKIPSAIAGGLRGLGGFLRGGGRGDVIPKLPPNLRHRHTFQQIEPVDHVSDSDMFVETSVSSENLMRNDGVTLQNCAHT